ncbi:MAG: dTMP kinase [Aestuariivita sp.]|nr:dTMP kinase [Aestuariivita sp.]
MAGFFITIEGIDGSGKSTQARLLRDKLVEIGHDVILTREPGGSKGAEEIRSLLLQGNTDRWSAETEILLFTAARRDHVERLIEPALIADQTVICDRFVDSTRIYQGYAHHNLRKLVDKLHNLMIFRNPDLTILIDIDPTIGLKRSFARSNHETRFENLGTAKQSIMRNNFLKLANDFPDRFVVFDGERDFGIIAKDIFSYVTKFNATQTTAKTHNG